MNGKGPTALELARTALACQRWQTAEKLVREAGLVQADALIVLASSLAGQKRTEEAEATARQAAEAFPGLPDVWVCLAGLLAELGRTEEAAAASARAADAAGRSPEALERHGLFTGSLGCWPEAVEALAEAARLEPLELRHRQHYSFALARAGWSLRAEAECRRVLSCFPEDLASWLLLQDLLTAHGSPEERKKALKRAKEVEREYPDSVEKAAAVLERLWPGPRLQKG